MINITTSACQHAIIYFVCWNISLWIQIHSLVVFLVHASWCFDIRALLTETTLLPASGQDGCVESHSPDQSPHGCWATGPLWASLPSSCFFLPLIHPVRFPFQGLFHLELLEIPLSVERHPSLALNSHFRQTCDWIRQASQCLSKMTTDLFKGRKYFWQDKFLCIDDSRRVSMA